ncbi:MAG: hypothetical protein IKC87_00165 [Clostridia bacterium]|nr:hypothetical protein [Clostridia bacterium]
MEENNKNHEYGSDIKIKSPLVTKLENFWYHYKWHTIAALFIIVCVVVCSVQACSRVNIDIHIMYAGNREISRTSADGDTPAYTRLKNALSAYTADYDGDGLTTLTLTTYFSLSPAEITEIENNPGLEVNHTLLAEDAEAMRTRFSIGEYYLCFMSPYVYGEYRETSDGVMMFAPIEKYAPEENELEYYDTYAVKLSSTKLYKNSPEVREILPEDTLIAIRINSAMASVFGGAENAENYAHAEDMLRKILGE